MKARKYFPILILLLVIAGLQQLTQMTGTVYYLTQMTMTAYYALLIIGLCLVMGYAGQLSLGHAGFFAIGGYTSAVLTTYDLTPLLAKGNSVISFLSAYGLLVSRENLYGETLLSVNPWLAFVVAIILTVVIAFLVGIPVLKLKGHYLAMATMGFGIIIFRVVLATEIFGEADGISDVPGFLLFPGIIVSGNFSNRVQNYYIACIILVIGFVLLQNLIDSRVGQGTAGHPWVRRGGQRHGGGYRALQTLHLCLKRRLCLDCRHFPYSLQRRHRPFRGRHHEVCPLRCHCRHWRHGKSVGGTGHGSRAQFPLLTRNVRLL
jgi:branched-chain amino acid transport system permease protein